VGDFTWWCCVALYGRLDNGATQSKHTLRWINQERAATDWLAVNECGGSAMMSEMNVR
jgi:hypothetical protein